MAKKFLDNAEEVVVVLEQFMILRDKEIHILLSYINLTTYDLKQATIIIQDEPFALPPTAKFTDFAALNVSGNLGQQLKAKIWAVLETEYKIEVSNYGDELGANDPVWTEA